MCFFCVCVCEWASACRLPVSPPEGHSASLPASNPVCPGEIEGSGRPPLTRGAPQIQSPAFHRHLTGLCTCPTRQNAAGGINLIQGPTQMEKRVNK